MISNSIDDLSCKTIKNNIMNNKSCTFTFDKVSVTAANKVLKLMKVKPPGIDELDVQFLKLVGDVISETLSHIINLSFEKVKLRKRIVCDQITFKLLCLVECRKGVVLDHYYFLFFQMICLLSCTVPLLSYRQMIPLSMCSIIML